MVANTLGTIQTTVNSKTVNESNVFINTSKMDSYVSRIKQYEKNIKTACTNLSTKTSTVVKKGYCAGVHKEKLTAFANKAKTIASEASSQGTRLANNVESAVKAYTVNLLQSAKDWQSALQILSQLLVR